MDMTDAVSEQSAQRNAESVGRVPQSDSDGLFAPRIPHTRDEHEARVRAGLGRTTEHSKDGEGGKTVACGLDHQEDTPTRMQRFVRQLENLGWKKFHSPHENVDAEIFPCQYKSARPPMDIQRLF